MALNEFSDLSPKEFEDRFHFAGNKRTFAEAVAREENKRKKGFKPHMTAPINLAEVS